MQAVLHLFAGMLGLQINFHKNMLVGVNIVDSWLQEVAFVLRCKVGRLPFLYLGLLIWRDARRLNILETLLDRIRLSSSGWKSIYLSFGGRLILLRWLGDEVLCFRLWVMFDLSDNKWTSVAEMERLGWGKVRVLGVGGGV